MIVSKLNGITLKNKSRKKTSQLIKKFKLINKQKNGLMQFSKKEKRKKYQSYKLLLKTKRKTYFLNIQFYLHYHHIYLKIKIKSNNNCPNNQLTKSKNMPI